MARITNPPHHRNYILIVLAALAQMLVTEACVSKRAIEAKLGRFGITTANETPSASALIQSTSGPDILGLGLVARSILGVTSRPITSSTTTTTADPIEDNHIKYADRYDFVSIDHVLKSPRLMKNFHECVMERGPCTSEGAELRRIIPEAMKSDCAKCTIKQRQQAGRVLAYILEHKPEWLQELFEKFDPDFEVRKRYEFEEEQNN